MTLMMSSGLSNLAESLCYKLVGHLPGKEGLTKDAIEFHWGNATDLVILELDPN